MAVTTKGVDNLIGLGDTDQNQRGYCHSVHQLHDLHGGWEFVNIFLDFWKRQKKSISNGFVIRQQAGDD